MLNTQKNTNSSVIKRNGCQSEASPYANSAYSSNQYIGKNATQSNGNLLNKVIFLLENNQFVLCKLLDLTIRILGNLETHKLQAKNHNNF